MSEPYQGLLSSNFLFVPSATATYNYLKESSSSSSTSPLMGSKTASSAWSSSVIPGGQLSTPALSNFNSFPFASNSVKRDELEVARYLRQLAECKLKELEFQKAQVQLLKESLPLYNPMANALSNMNFLPFASSVPTPTAVSSTPTSFLSSDLKSPTLPSTPVVPSPVLLSSYPSFSPFASNPLPTTSTPALSTSRHDAKPGVYVHPALSEVVSLFPARKSFICPEPGCGKALKTRLGLERHSRNHTGGRRFVCHVKGCNKKFLESNTLKRHLRIHTGEKPFLCPSEGCGRSFSDGSNYRRHLSTHSKEKPFKCPFLECKVKPYGFTRAATLRTHLLNFHNVKG